MFTILTVFKKDWDGRALLILALASKIIFALGSYEYLERAAGKIRKCLFC